MLEILYPVDYILLFCHRNNFCLGFFLNGYRSWYNFFWIFWKFDRFCINWLQFSFSFFSYLLNSINFEMFYFILCYFFHLKFNFPGRTWQVHCLIAILSKYDVACAVERHCMRVAINYICYFFFLFYQCFVMECMISYEHGLKKCILVRNDCRWQYINDYVDRRWWPSASDWNDWNAKGLRSVLRLLHFMCTTIKYIYFNI